MLSRHTHLHTHTHTHTYTHTHTSHFPHTCMHANCIHTTPISLFTHRRTHSHTSHRPLTYRHTPARHTSHFPHTYRHTPARHTSHFPHTYRHTPARHTVIPTLSPAVVPTKRRVQSSWIYVILFKRRAHCSFSRRVKQSRAL